MNPDDIDHDEHRAVQAHIDAEQASEAIHDRLQEITELLDRISTLVDNSRATINTAAAHDRLDDTEHELVGLERDMKSIWYTSAEVLTLLATPQTTPVTIDGNTYLVVDVITLPADH